MTKPTWTTSTARSTMVTIATYLGSLAFVKDGTLWAAGVAVILATYILSRAIMKKNRAVLIEKKPTQTSEFYAVITGGAALVAAMLTKKVDVDAALTAYAAIQGAYNLARGYTKSFSPTTTKVNVIR